MKVKTREKEDMNKKIEQWLNKRPCQFVRCWVHQIDFITMIRIEVEK